MNDPSFVRNNRGHGSGSDNNRRVSGAGLTMVKPIILFRFILFIKYVGRKRTKTEIRFDANIDD